MMSEAELALLAQIVEQNQTILDINFTILEFMAPSELEEVEMPEEGTKH